MTDYRSLEELAQEVDEPTYRDSAFSAGRLFVQAIPGVGGFVGEAISRVPTNRANRQQVFMVTIAAVVDAHSARLDHDFVRSEAFDDLVEDAMELANRRSEREKVDYYAAAFVNSVSTQRPDDATRDRFTATLRELRKSHLDLLAFIDRTKAGGPLGGRTYGSVADVILYEWPDVDIEAVKRDWGDLARHALVQSYPSGLMSSQAAISNIQQRMTKLGRDFVAFVTVASTTADKS